MTFEEMHTLEDSLQCGNYRIQILDANSPYLQVGQFIAGNLHKGRKWQLSYHMTKSEIVQTALKAILTFAEHEIREEFKYNGKTIFGPHIDVDALYDVCEEIEIREEVNKT